MTCCKNSIAVEEQHTGLAEQKAVQFKEKIKSQEETNRRKGKQAVWKEDSWTCPRLMPLCELKMALSLNLIFHRLLTPRWKEALRDMKGKWCIHQLEKQHDQNLAPPVPGEITPTSQLSRDTYWIFAGLAKGRCDVWFCMRQFDWAKEWMHSC